MFMILKNAIMLLLCISSIATISLLLLIKLLRKIYICNVFLYERSFNMNALDDFVYILFLLFIILIIIIF